MSKILTVVLFTFLVTSGASYAAVWGSGQHEYVVSFLKQELWQDGVRRSFDLLGERTRQDLLFPGLGTYQNEAQIDPLPEELTKALEQV